MNKNDITIATLTWARDEPEEQLLRTALSHLAELDIPACITDGGSGSGFLEFLSTFPHFTVYQPEVPGLVPQVRRSIRAAQETGTRFIFYTEPDKAAFFQQQLSEFMKKAPDDDEVGIVLASRSVQSFRTFPDFQQQTETAINTCCAEVIGKQIDYTYGPFLFNASLSPYLNKVENSIGWGWRPYLFGAAHRLGYKVEYQERDLPCPPEQREDNKEERLYRIRQLSQNIQGIVLSTTVS